VAVMFLFEVLIRATDNGSLFVPANVNNIILQNSYVLILAAGMLLCILTGGNIDLSVGSVICLVGAIAATLIVNLHCNIYLAIILSLVIGTAIGAWHGAFIAYLHIPPFITTLSGMLLWRGVALIVLDGMTISPFPQKYLNLFSSYIPEVFMPELSKQALTDAAAKAHLQAISLNVTMIVAILICALFIVMQFVSRKTKERKGYSVPSRTSFISSLVVITAVVLIVSWLLGHHHGIPTVLILLAVVIACYSYYTQHTVPGRYLYAIGGNVKAAKLSGVNTDNVMMFAYTNMGFLSAVAALVCIARFNSAAPTAGQSYEMDAIGSCFIGGASAYGGTGTVSGAVIGAIFMGVLNNGMSILGVDSNWQQAVKGFVLLLAVIFDVVSKQRKSR
ncbi:MAG: sugar ABC transporter permease, partial [Treponema sp.]|nr:sugar ABC transporter permease [Treponema sp.]